jgi:hypothetical protein
MFSLCYSFLYNTYYVNNIVIFLQLIHQPTTALSKIQFSININLLHVSALGAIFRKFFKFVNYNPNTLI